MSNVKLRIKADVQDDYSILEPLQLPVPLGKPGGAFQYPSFHTAVARNADGTREDLNVFCDTGYSTSGPYDILHLFSSGYDKWAMESTQFQQVLSPTSDANTSHVPVSSMVDEVTGGLHIAGSGSVGTWADGSPKFFLFYLNPNFRYKTWKSILLPPAGLGVVPCPTVQLGLDEQSRVCVYYRRNGSATVPFGSGVKWTPALPDSQALEDVPELAIHGTMPLGGAVFDWTMARYPDPAFDPTLKLHTGFLSAFSEDTHAPRLWRHTVGADQAVQVTKSIITAFQAITPVEDAAPLIFTRGYSDRGNGLAGPAQILFITNSHYSSSDVDDNAVLLFPDVSSKKTPVEVRAVVSNVSGLDAGETPDVFKIDVLGLFQLEDKSYELWHTSTMPQGVKEVSDGVYSVAQNQWTSSFFVTNNILSPKNYSFTSSGKEMFGFEVVENVPTAVIISPDMKFQIFSREAESADWIPSGVSNVLDLNSSSPAMTTTRACVVEITSMLEDGTVLPDLRCQLGTESVLNVVVAGKPYVLDSARSPELQFPPDGRLTIKIANNGELILPTFWIWVEGMPDGAKVDVQAGPKGIHEALSNVGTPGHPALADIVLGDNTPLVPPGQSAESLDTATKALHAVADVITGDTAPSPDEQKYIHKNTSRHVARTRAQNAKIPTLGRLTRENNVGFIFDCSGSKFSFRYLGAHEMADAHASLLQGPMGWFDDLLGDIGDFFCGVANGIVDAVKFVIETVADGVKATINFIVDGVTRVWNGVIDVASKAADLIVFVFDAIKTAIEKVIDWLKFWFNWNDIKLTARAFKGYIDGIGPTMTSFIDDTLVKVTDSAFEYAKEHIDSSADAVISALGTETVANVDSSLMSLVAPGGSGTNPEFAALSRFNLQDILDGLSTAAGYFFDVFSFLLGGGFQQKLSSSLDSKKLLGFVDTFFSSLRTQEVNADLERAWDDVKTFVSKFFSKSIFETVTLASLISAMRSVLKLGVDVMHALFQGMLSLFKEVALFASDIFTAPVNVPALSQLYSALMDNQQCTLSGVLSLVLAVPCTLVYKAITNTAPYQNAVAGQVEGVNDLPLPKEREIVGAAVTIVAGLYDAYSESKKAVGASIGDAGLAIRAVLSLGLVSGNGLHATELEEHTFAGSDLETKLAIGSQVYTFLQLLIRCSRTVTSLFRGAQAHELFYYAETYVSVSGLAYNLMVLAGSSSYTKPQNELAANGILSCFSGALAVFRVGPPTPATAAVAIIQAILSITCGSLQIAAASESSAFLVKEAGLIVAPDDVQDNEAQTALGERKVKFTPSVSIVAAHD